MAADGNWSARPPDPEGSPADLPRDRQFVAALARGLEILRAFAPNETLLGNQEIAARTGLPKPTVSRLTHTLTKLGYLDYSERLGKYQLGTPVLALGYAVLAGMGMRMVARPHMQELATRSGASVALGSRDRLDLLYVEYCRSNSAIGLRLDLGSRIPIATTSMGRAFLAALPERERGYLMDYIARREKERWPQLRRGIEQAIEDLAARGFTLSVGDYQKDVNAVGAPLILADGSPILAFNCGGPAFLLPRERLEGEIGPALVAMVRQVETALGHRRTASAA
jgi:DNA-binding IclR family transcriptional regulator